MEKLRTEDLMRGDWVNIAANKYRDGFTARVRCIYEHSIFTEDCKFEGEEVIIEDVSPIPLTAEILENSGIKKTPRCTFIYYKHWSMCYDIVEFEPITHILTIQIQRADQNAENITNSAYHLRCEFRINYVHELQHALRIFGIEKEVVL